jgi:hypothetical protein
MAMTQSRAVNGATGWVFCLADRHAMATARAERASGGGGIQNGRLALDHLQPRLAGTRN